MAYSVKEIFKTLQGEGGQSGRVAVFCRFAGCNLWSGREEDRAEAVCTFCDTDFVGIDGEGGGKFAHAEALAQRLAETWGEGRDERFVVFTGGEPLLQLDSALIDAVHAQGFFIAVESNGVLPPPPGVDWLCVSPKAGTPLQATAGAELKLVYPQPDLAPEIFEQLSFDHFWIQPMDGPNRDENTAAAVAYCLAHPLWRLSLQTHKMIGIP
jgi:7-carboxy-7-deazaguanine synthase (Cx14CxxC type)